MTLPSCPPQGGVHFAHITYATLFTGHLSEKGVDLGPAIRVSPADALVKQYAKSVNVDFDTVLPGEQLRGHVAGCPSLAAWRLRPVGRLGAARVMLVEVPAETEIPKLRVPGRKRFVLL